MATRLFTKQWWATVRERVARSAAQGFLVAAGPTVTGWMGADWKTLIYSTVGMGIMSLATSIAFNPVPKEEP